MQGPSFSIVQSKRAVDRPTSQAYQDLQHAFDHFNRTLFEGRLPHCLLTLTRKRRTLGFFAPERFTNTGGKIAHEISLNPRYLELQGDYDALSTLVHEQCHVVRYEFVPPNRNGGKGARGYHDRAFAKVMRAVGLVPSDTGQPGGRQTGYRMSHYVEAGGRFDVACRALLITGFTLRWRDKIQYTVSSKPRDLMPAQVIEGPVQTRAKFTCRNCNLNAWAKPSARLACLDCSSPMIAAT